MQTSIPEIQRVLEQARIQGLEPPSLEKLKILYEDDYSLTLEWSACHLSTPTRIKAIFLDGEWSIRLLTKPNTPTP